MGWVGSRTNSNVGQIRGPPRGGWRSHNSAKHLPGWGDFQGGWDGKAVAVTPRLVEFAYPPSRMEKHHTHGSPQEDPRAPWRAPLLVTTPLGFRMRRYEQSFYARRVMMSFRVLPALHNLHFTEKMNVFGLIFIVQKTPEFF